MSSFCGNCGFEKGEHKFCPKCGTSDTIAQTNKPNGTSLSTTALVLSLILPVIGLILGYVARSREQSNSSNKAAIIIGWVFGIIQIAAVIWVINQSVQANLDSIRNQAFCDYSSMC